MALNSLKCADVPLRNYSLTHTLSIPAATSALSVCKMCHCPRRFSTTLRKETCGRIVAGFSRLGADPVVHTMECPTSHSHPLASWASTWLLREEMSLPLCCCLKPVPRRQHIQMTKKNKMQPNVRQSERQACSTVCKWFSVELQKTRRRKHRDQEKVNFFNSCWSLFTDETTSLTRWRKTEKGSYALTFICDPVMC